MENIVCNFVSYKINEDALAEIFAGCGISDVCFSDNNGVKVARDNGLIFASENGTATLPQLIFTAWSGCSRSDLAEDAAAVFDSMACVYNGAAKLPCREYTLSFHYSGTAADKLSVLAELFEKTDIADALEVTETRTSAEGMQLACGTFGFERKGHFGGGLSAWRLNRTGTPYNEDSAALLLKDGEFSAFDTDSFTWDETSLAAAMAQAGTSDSPKGATVLKKLVCREIGELTVPPVFLEMAEGALTDCTSLKKVTFTKKNILINRNSIPAGAEVFGSEDSTAEKYAAENDLSFNKVPFP
ncbi:MAG: stress protein, partial [Ruminococcus sp.]|nr:stress protein [Ruminococcus sp.]